MLEHHHQTTTGQQASSRKTNLTTALDLRERARFAWVPLLLVCGFAAVFVASGAHAESPGIVVNVALTPAGDFRAKTDEIKGEAVLAEGKVKADTIVVPLKNLKSGIPLRDKHMRDKYLEIEKFPDAVLSNAVGQDGKGRAKLKLHGIEKDIVGTYKIDGGLLVADFPIKLSEFGISGIKYMGVGVDDLTKIHVAVPLKK